MFELFKKEMEDWRCQFGTSNGDKIGLRHVLHQRPLRCACHRGPADCSVLGAFAPEGIEGHANTRHQTDRRGLLPPQFGEYRVWTRMNADNRDRETI